jgi:hypothetical protein
MSESDDVIAAPAAGGQAAPAPAVSDQPAAEQPQGKPAEGQPNVDQTEAPTAQEAEQPQDALEYQFTMPEGFDSFDDEAMAAAVPLLQGAKVPPEVAQQLIDVVAGMVTRQMQQARDGLVQQQEQRAAQWLTELQGDKDFGGSRFDANAGAVRGLVERFGDTDPEIKDAAGKPIPGGAVKKALAEAGIGNNPALVRMLHRMARAIGEDTMVPGNPGTAADQPMSTKDYVDSVFSKAKTR